MFDDMIERIHGETASILLKIEVVKNEEGKEKMSVDKSSQKVAVKNAESKKAEVGRNDPCPCGSGKKYKNCCGKNL